jgi:hypothetical protein
MFGHLMTRLVVAVAVVSTVLLAVAGAPSAQGRYCTPIRDTRAEVIRLSSDLGCGTVGKLALKTTENSLGYYKSRSWYCRWGQGGTRPIRISGHVYYAGFCYRVPSFQGVAFLGRQLH